MFHPKSASARISQERRALRSREGPPPCRERVGTPPQKGVQGFSIIRPQSHPPPRRPSAPPRRPVAPSRAPPRVHAQTSGGRSRPEEYGFEAFFQDAPPEEPVLGPSSTNTHFFDGKLKELRGTISVDLDRAGSIGYDEKLRSFSTLFDCLRDLPGDGRSCFVAIVDSYESYGRSRSSVNQNYDSANDLYADDLLYLLYEKIVVLRSTEHSKLLITQLQEMSSGLCSQGRTTRLFQTLVMLKKKL